MSRESLERATAPAEPQDELERALSHWGRPGEGGAPDLTALRAGLDAELARERGWRAYLRSRATPVRVTAAGLWLLGAATATGLLGARVDMRLYPRWRLVLGLSVMLVGFLISVALALRPLSRPALRGSVVRTTLMSVPFALAALYAMPAAHRDHPASLQQPGALALLLRALPCLGVGTLIALLAIMALRGLDRGGSRATLLLASAGGVAANMLLLLHCSMTAPMHMVLGHLGVVLLVLAGAWLAQRVAAARG
jgi:hypothetical protein